MSSLRARVRPGISRRSDIALETSKVALLIVDIQKYLSKPGILEKEDSYLFRDALPRAIGNITQLIETFRMVRDDDDAEGCEVIFTYLQSLTKDGRDISLDYKLSGSKLAGIPRVGASHTELFLDDCCPDLETGKGDILLPKTSCSVFQSTNIDYVLRNLGIEQIVIVGQLTDQCVESAVRDAADLGYLVTVASDACAAQTEENHRNGLKGMKGFCRILSSQQVMDDLVEDVASKLSDEDLSCAAVSEAAVLNFLRSKGLKRQADEVARLLLSER